jgi:predicted enzyme involved in methoxymalonyl-ACP biosynthesis
MHFLVDLLRQSLSAGNAQERSEGVTEGNREREIERERTESCEETKKNLRLDYQKSSGGKSNMSQIAS